MKHLPLKQQLLQVVADAYDAAYQHDVEHAAKKPAVLQAIDAQFDKLLRPLFT